MGGKKDDGSGAQLTDKQRVEAGQVLCRIIIEVLGAPKEHVEESVQLMVDKINALKEIDVISESTYEAEQKDKLWSTFSELEIWFKHMDDLMAFLFEFTPSSVEVVLPETISMNSNMATGFFNDFLTKLHQMGIAYKDTSANIQVLKKNADTIIRNFLKFILEKPQSLEDISRITGIPSENAQAILESFEKAGIVMKDGADFVMKKKQ